MKIAWITNVPSPYQIRWAEQLRKRYEVEFWFMVNIGQGNVKLPEYWNIEMPEYCRIMPSKFKKGEFCYGPTLTKELRKFDPDIVVLGAGWYMIAWMQAYRWAVKNRKIIMMGPHEFSDQMYQFTKIIRNRIVFRLIYKKIDVILANAFIHYDYFKMIVKTQKNTIFMNFDDYGPYLKHSERSNNGTVTFMYGGRIEKNMRVIETIRVFEELVENYPNVRLVIGGYGAEKEACRQLVANSRVLSNTVIFYDVKSWDEIPDVFKISDVLINYACYSPGSGVIVSAVASGMGVITSISINSSRHFVIDKYNGFFVDDEKTLYRAMEKYILDPKLLEMHSKRSKDIGLSTLTFDTHLDDFDQIVQDRILYKNTTN